MLWSGTGNLVSPVAEILTVTKISLFACAEHRAGANPQAGSNEAALIKDQACCKAAALGSDQANNKEMSSYIKRIKNK